MCPPGTDAGLVHLQHRVSLGKAVYCDGPAGIALRGQLPIRSSEHERQLPVLLFRPTSGLQTLDVVGWQSSSFISQ